MVLRKINHPSYEQDLYEYEIRSSLQKSLNYGFLNCKDTNKFSPEILHSFKESSLSANIDNSMIEDNIFYLSTSPQGDIYYLDILSGLIYVKNKDKYRIAVKSCFSNEYDIFDAAYLRKYIKNQDFRKSIVLFEDEFLREITSLDYMGYYVEDIFSEPIPEYNISTLAELKKLVSEIDSTLSQTRFFRKLWFRGQRKEYTISRSQSTLDKLGFPSSFTEMPSLIPSLGRHVNNDNFPEIVVSNIYWRTAFKIWAMTQNENLVQDLQIDTPLYKELIKSLESHKMAEFLIKCPYDIEDCIFENGSEIRSATLSMQQYGALTSMLDITDDLDVALFFTQSYLNTQTKKYELCDPSKDNIIYLMAQCRNTSTYDLSSELFTFAPFDWKIDMPLRITNQKCGIQSGANIYAQNTYAYRIIAKIHLCGTDILTTKTVEEMFPSPNKDSLYKTYLDAFPVLNGLYG